MGGRPGTVTVSRPRRPRSASAIEFHLAKWAEVVRRAETGLPNYCDYPCCGPEEGLESRDRLEAIIRRGGKPGRRVAARVQPLDLRFEKATYLVDDQKQLGGWWWHRTWG